MKKHFKTYLLSLLISTFFIILPWILGELGIIPFINVLSVYAPICAVIGILLSLTYVVRKTSSWKPRVAMFFLNPGVYYLIIIFFIIIAFYHENWTGFDKLVP